VEKSIKNVGTFFSLCKLKKRILRHHNGICRFGPFPCAFTRFGIVKVDFTLQFIPCLNPELFLCRNAGKLKMNEMFSLS
jgi:hypothetical protein